jgi:hypothetical protein
MKQTNSLMKSAAFAAVLAAAVAPSALAGATAPAEKALDFTLSLTTDTFFGFAPMATASYALSDKLDFTAYGIFWSGGNNGGSWGNWTEAGAGLNFAITDYLSINPQLGFLGGSLISSTAAGEPVMGDGIVPNITMNLSSDNWEGQLYFGAYLSLRDEEFLVANADGDLVPTTGAEYLHYWCNFGRKLNPYVSAGVHYEQLCGGNDNIDSELFTWVGPYVQLTEPTTGTFLRVTAGADVTAADSFYKMTFGVSF